MAEQRAHAARSAARRGLNQHFLRSPDLAAQLVRSAALDRHDFVLEIGAGSGRLTTELARVAGRVLAVEIDPRWTHSLSRRFRCDSHVTVVRADALRMALPDESFRVVANLPFGRTTAFLHRLLDDPRLPLDRADLIVQWGAALKRAAIWPSTLLGVTWGAWWTFRIERRLAASCFEPTPSVDAALLVVARRDVPLVPAADERAYRAFVRRGFREGLRAVAPSRQVRRVARRAAPRDLDAHEWAALFHAVRGTR